jgi:hypothetical protein
VAVILQKYTTHTTQDNTPHSNKTQHINYKSNKGHTTQNEYTMQIRFTTITKSITTTILSKAISFELRSEHEPLHTGCPKSPLTDAVKCDYFLLALRFLFAAYANSVVIVAFVSVSCCV